MARHSDGQRWAAGRVAQMEAKRRAVAVSKVGLVIVVTVLATLVLSGHRMAYSMSGMVPCWKITTGSPNTPLTRSAVRDQAMTPS